MAIKDVQDSIDWAKKGGVVHAYFTVHFARPTDDAGKDEHDTVRYAIGELEDEGGILAGDLRTVFANTGVTKFTGPNSAPVGIDEGMVHKRTLSYRLEVHPDGTIGVQAKLNGKPIMGLPVEKVAGKAVSTGLLHAASTTTVYSVSLDRQAKTPVPA